MRLEGWKIEMCEVVKCIGNDKHALHSCTYMTYNALKTVFLFYHNITMNFSQLLTMINLHGKICGTHKVDSFHPTDNFFFLFAFTTSLIWFEISSDIK
jgi:hypothetical protein